MPQKILVLGVGNILLADEGIGVRAIEHLQNHYSFPAHVRLLEGGTQGLMLMDALMDCDILIVLDAVLGKGEPGTFYRLTDDNLRQSLTFRDSMHQTDLVDTLISCDLAGHRPDAIVLGMQPADYTSLCPELTPAVAQRLPAFCDWALKELRALGVSATPLASPMEQKPL